MIQYDRVYAPANILYS